MLQTIRHAQSRLSPAEKQVGRWILAHPQRATTVTVAELAKAAGTSEPTVIRFCRRLGAAGFTDLKLRLVEALSRAESFAHQHVREDDSTPDAVVKVMNSSIQALLDVRARLAGLPFEAAVEAMTGARQLVFAGLGASGVVALDACQKFFRIGLPCAAATDTPTVQQMGAIAEAADVFVFISHTGRWPELARAASAARDRGACVMALTAPGNALAKVAALNFGISVDEDTSVYTPMSSRLAQLAILDALQVALTLRLGHAAEEKLRAAKQALPTV